MRAAFCIDTVPALIQCGRMGIIMTIDESMLYIQKKYPKLECRISRDVNAKEEEFCEMVFSNEANPGFPITVTVFDDGCTLSVGRIENIIGDARTNAENIVLAMEDVISDRIIFVVGFADRDKFEDNKSNYSRVFAVTGREDDMSREYERFIGTLNKPLSKAARLFAQLKGIFVICNYSGKINMTVSR